MTVKELEKRTGLPRTSIRFYEQEGLITPERRSNNYRDYSEEDARTLEKIKLLRQLSLDLDTIRRLEAEELSLAQAMAEQADLLEEDRDDLERYAQLCQELGRSGVTYGELDPEPWLRALEEKSLPLSRRVDPAQTDSVAAAPYPGRRFFARGLDLTLASALWCVLQNLVFHWYIPEGLYYEIPKWLAEYYGGWLALFLLEPLLLATWGWTPGKWLMGLKLRRGDGRKLAWDDGVERLAWLFFKGYGLGIFPVSILCNVKSYERCEADMVLPWDEGLNYTAEPLRGKKLARRAAGLALCFLLLDAASLWAEDAGWRLPAPAGPLTAEQVAENYNFLERRNAGAIFTVEPRPYGKLALDGQWLRPLPGYERRGKDWVELGHGEKGEWGPVEFTVNEDGFVTGFTVLWSPKGSPYEEDLDLWLRFSELFDPMLMAVSPGAEDWAFPWIVSLSIQKQDGVEAIEKLLMAEFSGTGTQKTAEMANGTAVKMEVLSCEDCTGENLMNLCQTRPGAGVLDLRLTVTLPNA